MSGVEFNKCAISMGKVLKMLSELRPKIVRTSDIEKNKEELLIIAYVCRVGILDRIENNPSWIKNNLPIRIPISFFNSKKVSISSGVDLTVEDLYELTKHDIEIKNLIKNVLDKGQAFYDFERILPLDFIKNI